MGVKRNSPKVLFLILFLWPRKTKFWRSCQKCFGQKSEKILLRCEIDWRIITSIFHFHRKILIDTQKAVLSFQLKSFSQISENFWLNVQKWQKSRFLSEKCYRSKCLYVHGDCSFGNFQRKDQSFSLNIKKRRKNWDENFSFRRFLPTFRLQFWQTCRKVFARRPKRLLEVQNLWVYSFFSEHFLPSDCFYGYVKCSNSSRNVFVKKAKIYRLRSEKDMKFIKIIFFLWIRKSSTGYIEWSSLNTVENFLPEGNFFLLSIQIWLKKKNFVEKTFSFKV